MAVHNPFSRVPEIWPARIASPVVLTKQPMRPPANARNTPPRIAQNAIPPASHVLEPKSSADTAPDKAPIGKPIAAPRSRPRSVSRPLTGRVQIELPGGLMTIAPTEQRY